MLTASNKRGSGRQGLLNPGEAGGGSCGDVHGEVTGVHTCGHTHSLLCVMSDSLWESPPISALLFFGGGGAGGGFETGFLCVALAVLALKL